LTVSRRTQLWLGQGRIGGYGVQLEPQLTATAAAAPPIPRQALDMMVKKFMLADVVTVIGTLDVVFGEIDR
jgi:hypothetical protein